MTQAELTDWALANGWQMLAGGPCLTKPSAPKEAIVRMVFKATVVSVEVKKPAGKWEKVASTAYKAVIADPDGEDMPRGLGFETIPSFRTLMRDNKDRQVFSGLGR